MPGKAAPWRPTKCLTNLSLPSASSLLGERQGLRSSAQALKASGAVCALDPFPPPSALVLAFPVPLQYPFGPGMWAIDTFSHPCLCCLPSRGAKSNPYWGQEGHIDKQSININKKNIRNKMMVAPGHGVRDTGGGAVSRGRVCGLQGQPQLSPCRMWPQDNRSRCASPSHRFPACHLSTGGAPCMGP